MHEPWNQQTRPWTMTFRVSGEPRCPGCCVVLAGVVITFNEGWAWCPVCTNQAIYANTHIRYVMQHRVMRRCSILSHGLHFYVPTPVEGVLLNAIDEYERLVNQPEETVPAIAAWPGFDLVQLPQSVRDRAAATVRHYCKPIKVPSGYEIAGLASDGRVVLLEQNEPQQPLPDENLHHCNSGGNRE